MKGGEMDAELNLAEILYDTGELRFRYTRMLSADGTRWIRHGLFCEYHRNGTVISEGHYVQGRENGLWRDFYETGAPAAEGHYLDGAETGDWRYWDASGNSAVRA
ncbi:hypothetical protein [Janthinobacterium sp. 78]|jgi:antitoxin component YwqK of YwqJK toxin-antitoxin module|uniref:toxin-antitoxin system YwqK family antitoxin n=1 Tax=Janthinobacterium sp. 78 TaxID=2135631 RepID=UPI000D5E678B|nr:hypothetical protein [Janthinobacterium sp. 78]PVX37274.1 MORN repeat protein [Janthinobacterium sp. 78]